MEKNKLQSFLTNITGFSILDLCIGLLVGESRDFNMMLVKVMVLSFVILILSFMTNTNK